METAQVIVKEGPRRVAFEFQSLADLHWKLERLHALGYLSARSCSGALNDVMRLMEGSDDAGHTDAERIRPASFFLIALGWLLGLAVASLVEATQ